MKRVVITGAGTINALGHSVAETMEPCAKGAVALARLSFATLIRLAIKHRRAGSRVRS